MSSPTDRLALVQDAYSKAYARRPDDLKQATSSDQVQQILDNVDMLEEQYLDAARQALDAGGSAVEQAYRDATTAKQQVEQAYENALELPDRIAAVTTLADNVQKLVVAATG
jgi:tryptophan 2,3-dioxygenase